MSFLIMFIELTVELTRCDFPLPLFRSRLSGWAAEDTVVVRDNENKIKNVTLVI